MIRTLLTIAACTAPLGALAACPVAADLAGGIKVGFRDGSTSVFRPAGPDTVAEHNRAQDETTWSVIESYRGIAETTFYEADSLADTAPSTSPQLDYTLNLDDMFPLTNGKEAFGVQTEQTADSSDPTRIAYSYKIGAETQITIGGCTYRTVPITTGYLFPNGRQLTVELAHLPELGLSFTTELTENGDTTISKPTSIQAN